MRCAEGCNVCKAPCTNYFNPQAMEAKGIPTQFQFTYLVLNGGLDSCSVFSTPSVRNGAVYGEVTLTLLSAMMDRRAIVVWALSLANDCDKDMHP